MKTSSLSDTSAMRDLITKAYRMDEAKCLESLLPEASFSDSDRQKVLETAKELVIGTRENQKKQSKIDSLLHKYDLSTEEGISLMCMAEALLRIPDKTTMDKFISDKLSDGEWRNHLSSDNSMFVNAATWSLLLTGGIYAPALNDNKTLGSALSRTASRMGTAVIRPIILQMMKAIGKQFVMGEDINAALKRAKEFEDQGYTFSYDMLGEAARTEGQANAYYDAYVNAIEAIGRAAKPGSNPHNNSGVSVKLSGLHPRYEFSKHDEVVEALVPKLLTLAKMAKQYNIGLTVDAEEADRLDLMLDIYERVYSDPALDGWVGLGMAVQAYQRRAPYVLDWLAALSRNHGRQMKIRLVKGAYWDAEIKLSQVMGFRDYPVFTRKDSTDVSYIACARKMLSQPECFYSQFGTHNSYTVAAIMQIAGNSPNFEFQCLHGMGAPLYNQIVEKQKYGLPVRIYAPVGTHKDLLGYLVRRLLENGANSSFVNKLADTSTPLDKIVYDPAERIASLANKPHPKIPAPKDIYGAWPNSLGVDLSDADDRAKLQASMDRQLASKKSWFAAPVINGTIRKNGESRQTYSPIDKNELLGTVYRATDADVEDALNTAVAAQKDWAETPVEKRAEIVRKVGELMQAEMGEFAALMSREAGKSLPDCISEVREAIDYCNYYAYRALEDLKPAELPGPTGESNVLMLYPRGIVVTIAPWNFPLAIFSGQILAALVTGNVVIAKPAEQSPIIAYKAVEIMHKAGVPKNVLQLALGRGSEVGARLVSDERIAGVMFTGSTATAKFIEQALAARKGPFGFMVAETGGQNAMIVDSSALAEQTVIDIAMSAFNSAGQRCSALRVLFVQEEMAPILIPILKGYMQQMQIGDPGDLATDVGPVIDQSALNMLREHYAKMSRQGKLIAEVPMPHGLNGNFFAPCAFEIDDLAILEGEVFGPFLHIIRYKSNELEKVMQAIINTGYGLTLGIHSRIDQIANYVSTHMPVGNIYINRNMVGAVVGVQPFGGERLSGTGPKAGGPHYLPRLCVERTISTNTTAVGGNARLVSLLEED